MLMMWPSFCFCMIGSTAATPYKRPLMFTSIPFFDLERRHRCDGHDPGIVHDRVDSAVLVNGASHQSLDISALCHISLETESAASLGANVPDEGVDPIFAPRSERDFRAIPCEKASRAFANTAAGPRNYYNFVGDI